MTASAPLLAADALTLGYRGDPVIRALDLGIEAGGITAIVGPNGCGKSTLLRGLAGLIPALEGTVRFEGDDIATLAGRRLASRVAVLPQQPIAPDGITVRDLVGRGRYPHQGLFRRWTATDTTAVDDALARTGVADLAERPVTELSGGQRQRVWIAMVVAQGTPVLLLDEPTTFLDVAHQVEVLDLLLELQRVDGRTIVLVLHDLNLAARYADRMVVLSQGAIAADGPPARVLTAEVVERAFGLASRVVPDPVTGTPLVVPVGRFHPGDGHGNATSTPHPAS